MKNLFLLCSAILMITSCSKNEVEPSPQQGQITTKKYSQNYITKISFKETSDFKQYIDSVEHKIYLVFRQEAPLDSLTPLLTMSNNTKSDFPTDRPLDFTIPQEIGVTTEDGLKVVYTVESVKTKVNIRALFYYELDGDSTTRDRAGSYLIFTQGRDFMVFNYNNQLNLSSGKLKIDYSSEPLYLQSNLITSFSFYIRINNKILSKDFIGEYKYSYPEAYIDFFCYYANRGFGFNPASYINITTYSKEFNTISGYISRSGDIDLTFNDKSEPNRVKFDNFEFENIPL